MSLSHSTAAVSANREQPRGVDPGTPTMRSRASLDRMIRTRSRGSILVPGPRSLAPALPQQPLDPLALVDGVVVLEAQLGDAAHAHGVREFVAELLRERLQRLHDFGGPLRLQRGDPDGRDVEFPAYLDVHHAGLRQRMVPRRRVYQRTDLATEFGIDAVGAMERALGHCSFRKPVRARK